MVKMVEISMDNPQPSPKGGKTLMDAVQRLDVGGLSRKIRRKLKV